MSDQDRAPSGNATVCVIGAGPSGSLIAYRLASAGHDVVILEAGDRFEESTREERMERALRDIHPWTSVWEMDESRDAYSNSGPVEYPVNRKRAKGVGGSTLHWGGRVARFPEKNFELQSRYGVARDWPISYGDLQPYYADAEQELGVSGADDNPFGPPREEEYPMPAFERSYPDTVFAEACEELGITVHSVPHARNSEVYDGRSQCVGYGTCSPVCPSGAKYDASVHARKAIQEGARLIDRAVVQRLEHDSSGDRVTGAVYRTPDGSQHTQTADEFVLAAGGIENPRLLLLSESPQYPDGLANSSGTVGKYLMEHPYVGMTGELDRPMEQNQIGFDTMETYQFYEPDDPPPGSYKIEFQNDAGPTPVDVALQHREPLLDFPLVASDVTNNDALAELSGQEYPMRWGDGLRDIVAEATGNYFSVTAEIEMLPHAENRVTLNRDRTDKFGSPIPDVSWGYTSEYEEATKEAALEEIERIVDELDATVLASSQFEFMKGAGHNSGTTRMGTDPSESVVDENQRAHDVENLSIAGASTFVSIGASQPTLTIAATSLRLADYLTDEVLSG